MKAFFQKMKMNLPVRMQNVWFWVGLGSIILTAMDVSPEMFTNWVMVWQEVVDLFSNPFQLGCVILAVLGVFVDPTTAGIGDSTRALSYTKPNKE